jgi:hypothetical protein
MKEHVRHAYSPLIIASKNSLSCYFHHRSASKRSCFRKAWVNQQKIAYLKKESTEGKPAASWQSQRITIICMSNTKLQLARPSESPVQYYLYQEGPTRKSIHSPVLQSSGISRSLLHRVTTPFEILTSQRISTRVSLRVLAGTAQGSSDKPCPIIKESLLRVFALWRMFC